MTILKQIPITIMILANICFNKIQSQNESNILYKINSKINICFIYFMRRKNEIPLGFRPLNSQMK